MVVRNGAETMNEEETHLGHEKQHPNEAQAARNVGEPEPEPPGKQLDDVSVDENAPALISMLARTGTTVLISPAVCMRMESYDISPTF